MFHTAYKSRNNLLSIYESLIPAVLLFIIFLAIVRFVRQWPIKGKCGE